MRSKLLLLSLLSLFNLEAFAHNCAGQFDPTSGSCRIIGPDGREIIYNSDPPQAENGYNSTNQAPHIIYLDYKYGALAINHDNGAVADAHNHNSKQTAKKLALAKLGCEKESNSCEIIATVGNGCIAAAYGHMPNGKFMVREGIDEPGKSEADALYRCQLTGASNCKIFIPENCSHPLLFEN